MAKTKKYLKNGNVAAIDSKLTGEEPMWHDALHLSYEDIRRRFATGLNFYNYYLDADDYVPILEEFMTKGGYDKKTVKQIRRVPRNPEFTTAGKIARMLNMGMPDSNKEYASQVRMRINNLLAMIQPDETKANESQTSDQPKKPSVFDIMTEKVRKEVLCELEGMLDEWIVNSTANISKANLVSLLKAVNAPVSALKPVSEWLTKQRNEYNEAYEKTCPQMVEGYSYLSKPALRKRIQLLDELLNDVVLYKSSGKTTRKARAKKPKSAEKLVARMKYLNQSPDYSVTSVNPTLLIGAQTAYLFNEKYRRLTVLVANDRGGLTVNGSSIKNFDEKNSFAMGLRKPKDILPIIVSKTDKQIENALSKLTTKKSKPNGRVNENTILLRVL